MKEFSDDQLQFAALVAHQLKGPMAAVSSLLQSIQGELAGPITPKQREILGKAIIRCNETIGSSQRLLNISRALNDPDSFKGSADLIPIIRDAVEHYQQKANQQNINIQTNLSFVKAFARGNSAPLAEVFEALLNNALKYTPEHGQIKIELTEDRQQKFFIIEVSDSGIGIPEQDIDKLFRPFYRSSSATGSSRPGTGLGLSLVKAIITACQGTVTAGKSDLGGAQFTIQIPILSKQLEHETDQTKPSMKVIIIGGVAAGPKVASKIMRLQPSADVTIIEKGKLLSYAGCGFPYYISGQVQSQIELTSSPVGQVRDPIFFQKIKNVHILNQTQAIEIDRENKKVKAVNLVTKDHVILDYDKLVLATGSLPVIPKCSGIELTNIFTLHGPSDAEGIKASLERTKAKDVVIVGGGLIGIEMTEALANRGCRITIVEQKKQILPLIDYDISLLIENHLESKGVKVITDTEVLSFEPYSEQSNVRSVVTTSGDITADMVIIAAGVKPNTTLAQKAGLEIGTFSGIKVNTQLQTSDENIYAAGDCVETTNLITGKPYYIPLGSIANKQGRIVANNICGSKTDFPGVLATICCKVFEYSVAKTGLTETEAAQAGYDVLTVYAPGPDREHFANDAKYIYLKLIADRKTGKVLGAQSTGPGESVKRIDIASMAILNKMTIYDLANADLCYGPPFSPVIDNIIMAANIASNKINNYFQGISPIKFRHMLETDPELYILDVRTPGEFQQQRLPDSNSIPLASLRARLGEIPTDKTIVTLCNVSLRAYEAAIILKSAGFQNVKVLEGGLEMWPFEKIR